MASPIKETPVLRGADAKKFRQALKEHEKKRVSKEELISIKQSAEKFKAIQKF